MCLCNCHCVNLQQRNRTVSEIIQYLQKANIELKVKALSHDFHPMIYLTSHLMESHHNVHDNVLSTKRQNNWIDEAE
jgi:SOS response regulatory protein OraA/RecX